MALKPWLIFICSSIAIGANAADSNQSIEQELLQQKIEQAIVKFEQTPREFWAYQKSSYENEEGDVSSSIERFTPNKALDKRWTLLQINGDKPSQKQLKKYLKNKEKLANNKKEGKNYSIQLRELINQDSLKFHSENTSHIKMGFDVYVSHLGEDAKGKLDGILSYHKQDDFIEDITITNNAKFSPMLSASITDLSMTLSFVQINNAVLPSEQALDMKGTFAYFVEIDEVSTDTISNYQYMPPSNEE